jgi:hypothetical protein
MAVEQYSNNTSSTLNGGINSSVPSITVTDGSVFPSVGDFRIIVDSEIMLVTNRSTNVLTVTRGAEGTTAATHSSGAMVTVILTRASLLKLNEDGVGYGLFSARPAAGRVGRLFFATNLAVYYRDNGSTWDTIGPVGYLTKPPISSSFTTVNLGSSIVTDVDSGIIITNEGNGAGEFLTSLVKTMTATPCTLKIGFQWICTNINHSFAGMVLRQSSNGKQLKFGVLRDGDFAFQTRKIDSPTGGGATNTITLKNFLPNDMIWLKYQNTGTNRQVFLSTNGVHWLSLGSSSNTLDLTEDQWGFGVWTFFGTTSLAQINLIHYLEESGLT